MRWMMVALAGLAGCSGGDAGVPQNVTVVAGPGSGRPVNDWVGRWTGVEGMVLDIARSAGEDRYQLTMQYDLDHKGTFEGIGTSEYEGAAITFQRDGRRETLRETDGTATGLKYLAGKKDCLTVKSGEGYCRD